MSWAPPQRYPASPQLVLDGEKMVVAVGRGLSRWVRLVGVERPSYDKLYRACGWMSGDGDGLRVVKVGEEGIWDLAEVYVFGPENELVNVRSMM